MTALSKRASSELTGRPIKPLRSAVIIQAFSTTLRTSSSFLTLLHTEFLYAQYKDSFCCIIFRSHGKIPRPMIEETYPQKSLTKANLHNPPSLGILGKCMQPKTSYLQPPSKHCGLCEYIISPFTNSHLSWKTKVNWLKAIFLLILFHIHIDFTHSCSSHFLEARRYKSSLSFL